ncbi:MAG: two-component system sensor histidine kinase/response regulator, partial [Proteobacteria bacterium]
MNKPSSIDEQSFRRLLSRNVGLPLGVGVLSVAVFIAIIVYLLSVIDWVEHTDRVINNANEATKLSIDMETGMRGYLLSGAEGYLDPYELAKPRLAAELPALQALVADNPRQVDRLTRIMALQKDWLDYGGELIALKRATGDYS